MKILFDSYHLYHFPQFEPVVKLLSAQSDIQLYFSHASGIPAAEKEILSTVFQRFPGEVITADSEEHRADRIRRLEPDVFLCGWSRYPLNEFVPPRTWVGMIYHGIGVKPSYWRDHNHRLDVRFVEGPLRLRQLQQRRLPGELILTGYAKLDPLFNGSLDEPFHPSLRESTAKPLLLYAPTFYPSSLEKFGMKLGDLTQDYQVILKLHMWTYFLDEWSGISLKRQRRLAEKLARKFNHITLLGPEVYNIVPYYALADILLTEASSTIYEMMALNKPVVVADFYRLRLSHQLFRKRIYQRRLDREMSQEMTDFCFHLAEPQQLPAVLQEAFTANDRYDDLRKQYQQDMLYRLDGRASHRIVQAIQRHFHPES